MNRVVSIITPSFNRADVIHETASSIFAQTYPHWEWIIVDDGSTDNSWELLESFAAVDGRVKIFRRDRDPKGACACRNIAVEKSAGEYLIFLDSDDIMATFCLEQRVDAICKFPDADFVIFPMLLFKHRPDDLMLLWNIDKPEDDIDRVLNGDAICQGTGTLWRKKSFVDIGLWDEELLLWQDIELHLRSLMKPLRYEKCMYLKPDVFLRVSEVSLSRTGFQTYPKFRSRLRVLKQALSLAESRGLVEKHRKGFQKMLKDILVNAALSNYRKDIPEVLELDEKYKLFDQSTKKKMSQYVFLRKSRLYKFPFLQRLAENALNDPERNPEITLNKIPFTGELLP